jgi:hypothetical protein
MTHSFDVEIAQEIGLEKAIILNNIAFWVNKNVANKKHTHNGKTYTYNSYEAFAKLFPYMKINTIKRVIREMEEEGILESRTDLNESTHDHTKWYCVGSHSIVKKITIEDEKNNHPSLEKSSSYKNNNQRQIINTDNKTTDIKQEKEEEKEISHLLPQSVDVALFKDYLTLRKTLKAPNTQRAINGLINKLVDLEAKGHDINAIIATAYESGWKTFYPPTTNSNNRYKPQIGANTQIALDSNVWNLLGSTTNNTQGVIRG